MSVFFALFLPVAAAFARLSKKGLANNARLPSSADVTSGWLDGIVFFRIPFHSQTKPPWPWPPGGVALALVESGSDFEGIEGSSGFFCELPEDAALLQPFQDFFPMSYSRSPDVLFAKKCRQIVAATPRNHSNHFNFAFFGVNPRSG